MRPKIITADPRRFAFAEPVLIVAMLSLIAILALPKMKTLHVQARTAQSRSTNLHANGTVGNGVQSATPAEADLPAGVRLGTYGAFRIDDLP
jgi:hypothetical protein